MLSKIKNSLIVKEPFFGYLLLKLKIKENSNIPTMRTDGISIEYSPSFVRDTPKDEIEVILIHEILHNVLLHIKRGAGHIPEISNYAADYAVNAYIKHNTPYTLPAHGLYEVKYKDMSYEAIYADLIKQAQDNQPDPTLVTLSNKMGTFEAAPDSTINQETHGLSLEEFWTNNALQAAQIQKMSGKGSANIEELIKNLLPGKLNWTILLKKFLTKYNKLGSDWNERNRRSFSLGKYLPAKKDGMKLNEIVMAVDTSGSMSNEEFQKLLGEVNKIFKSFKFNKIWLIQCDWDIKKVETFKRKTIRSEYKMEGRGGTRFEPVFDYVRTNKINPQCLIYFTDMGSSFNFKKPNYPVLWIDTATKGEYKAPFGKTIAI